MARLIVDTNVLIAAERAGQSVADHLDDGDDAAIAAITAAELLVGVEMADDKHRSARSHYVDTLLGIVTIEGYDLAVARVHAELLGWTRRSGTPRGVFDLIIAATARATGRVVATSDPSGFDGLPGVSLTLF